MEKMPGVLDATILLLESVPPALDAARFERYELLHQIGVGGHAEVLLDSPEARTDFIARLPSTSRGGSHRCHRRTTPGRERASSVALPVDQLAYKHGGLAALRPDARSNRGRARALTRAARSCSTFGASIPVRLAALILRTLVNDGRLAKGAVSVSTLVRFYRAKLPRGARPSGHPRLRWQADHPGACGTATYAMARRCASARRPSRCGSTRCSTTPRATWSRWMHPACSRPHASLAHAS
jgi:hypothetical protein